jgi:hypothetical protein
MRDQLIGYLLDALEPAEHEMVEAQLRLDPHLKHELAVLARCLGPLAADRGYFEPPCGLAHRTCEFVAQQAQTTLPPAGGYQRSRWRLSDLVVAAGIFFAAVTLFFPAVNQSRFAARLAGCQNNLRQIGLALTSYSEAHNGYFPTVASDGRLGVAGAYASQLIDHGFLDDSQAVVCPASSLAERTGGFRVPTLEQLRQAHGQELARLQKLIGGSYGYNLGYVSNGRYQSTKNLRRPTFALMADAPTSEPPYVSLNHGGCGQNVLFEDQHVQYLTTCNAQGCEDNIYLNDRGEMAPGVHVHDAVIGPSQARPLVPQSKDASELLNR